MKKPLLISIIAILLIGLAVGGYFYWKAQKQKSATEQTGVFPAIDTGAVNPMESVQSANPYNKANPFSDIKVNPFQ
jgi:hypothetical protein